MMKEIERARQMNREGITVGVLSCPQISLTH